jgi:hypothetical protein
MISGLTASAAAASEQLLPLANEARRAGFGDSRIYLLRDQGDICRVALDAAGTPVAVNEMTADSSAYIFRYEFGTG